MITQYKTLGRVKDMITMRSFVPRRVNQDLNGTIKIIECEEEIADWSKTQCNFNIVAY